MSKKSIISINRVAILSVCVFVVTILSGCATYELTPETTLKYSFAKDERYFWENDSLKEEISDFDSVRKSVAGFYDAENPNFIDVKCETVDKGKMRIANFLHISDAHIRDEKMHEEWMTKFQLKLLDKFLQLFGKDAAPGSVRDPFVDKFDSLTLASFLVAYNKYVRGCKSLEELNPFIIHTGDILGLSIVTELREATRVLKGIYDPPHYMNVHLKLAAGNHDGLFFGNLSDRNTKTRGLGVNKSEFVLGMLVDGVDSGGYGFAGNEIVEQIKKVVGGDNKSIIKGICGSEIIFDCSDNVSPYGKHYCDSITDQYENLCKTYRQISDFHENCGKENILKHPLSFRKLIKIPGDTEQIGLKLGYYSWFGQELKGETGNLSRIRYIVLDTRDNWPDRRRDKYIHPEGVMDLVQLGWLYNELVETVRNGEGVVIFAHHSPFAMAQKGHYTTKIFNRMLDQFPNIIAYFYGHRHPDKNREETKKSKRKNKEIEGGKCIDTVLYVQTESLIDYPQVGRLVDMYLIGPSSKNEADNISCEIQIDWRYVRPKGNKFANGWLLDSILENSQHLAGKDTDKSRVDDWKAECNDQVKKQVQVLLQFDKHIFPTKEDIFKKEKILNTADRIRSKLKVLKVGEAKNT